MSAGAVPKTIFFFGAGASKPAGVGTTVELVDSFREFLASRQEDQLRHALNEIVSHLNEKNLDIEQLMTVLERLSTRDNDHLLKFYNNTLNLTHANDISKLQEKLKEFIQETTSVKEDKISYLRPLLSFTKPLVIFSVNYDTAVEQFCNVYGLRYTDGFEYEWNPKLFEDPSYDFHLHKIHGSIMWYRTNKNNYVKLPIPPKGNLELIFGEQAIPLILYPMQKWEFVEPLLEMLLKFKRHLENADFVIVVGYSFRDSHIIRLFHEAARKNQKLTVLLIGPSSRQGYEEKLKFYTDEEGNKTKIPSMLEGRVLCLQYGFENIIVKLKETIDKCTSARIFESDLQNDVIAGRPVDPTTLLSVLAETEFFDRANKLRNNIKTMDLIAGPVNTSLMLSGFKLFVTAEIQGEQESADYWLDLFLTMFNRINFLITPRIRASETVIEFPQYPTVTGNAGSHNDISNLHSFILQQKALRGKYFSDILNDLSEKILLWIRHNDDILLYGSVGYSDYHFKINDFYNIWLGEEEIPKPLQALLSLIDENNRIVDFNKNEQIVRQNIIATEDVIMKKIFDGEDNVRKFMLKKYKSRVIK